MDLMASARTVLAGILLAPGSSGPALNPVLVVSPLWRQHVPDDFADGARCGDGVAASKIG
jgi:hypothetical protein